MTIPYESITKVLHGTQLLKFGRHGAPHYTSVSVSPDYKTLTYSSKRKRSQDSQLNLSEMELLKGQETAVFKRNDRQDLAKTSFSLIVKSTKRSLDLACKDSDEYLTWTSALEYLILNGPPPPKKIELAPTTTPKNLEEPVITPKSPIPSPVSLRTTRKKGEDHIKLLRESFKDANDVYSHGFGGWGQLGSGGDDDVFNSPPVLIRSLLKHGIQLASCGFDHSLFLSKSGEIFSCGNGGGGRLGLGHCAHTCTPTLIQVNPDVTFKHVACGDNHSLAVDSAGAVYAWGCNVDNQLGLGKDSNAQDQATPQKLPKFDNDIVLVDAGHAYSVALDSKGQVYTWGAGDSGVLGHGGVQDEPLPKCVSSLTSPVRLFVAGSFHMIAVCSGSELHSWGDGQNGQLGHGDFNSSTSPKSLQMLQDYHIKAVSAGSASSAVVASASDNTPSSGNNVYMFGAIGSVASSVYKVPVPTMISQLRGASIRSVTCGNFCTAAVSESGRVFVWGEERVLSNKPTPEPTLLDGFQDKLIRGVVCGGRFSLLIVAKEWIKDSEATNCMVCQAEFTMLRRKHHCRRCGCIACSNCASRRRALLHLGYVEPVRVCDECFGEDM